MTKHPHEINDSNLVQRTAEGDPMAFKELYDRHSTLVFCIALKILNDREEAKDVRQQVFLKLLTKSFLYTPPKSGSAAAWLAALTRNQSIDRFRQLKHQHSALEKLYHEEATLNTLSQPGKGYADYSDVVELLHGAMGALKPDEIHVLHLAYFGNLSHTEISDQLSQPLGSIKARIRRTLTKLRVSLEGVVEQETTAHEGSCQFLWSHHSINSIQ